MDDFAIDRGAEEVAPKRPLDFEPIGKSPYSCFNGTRAAGGVVVFGIP